MSSSTPSISSARPSPRSSSAPTPRRSPRPYLALAALAAAPGAMLVLLDVVGGRCDSTDPNCTVSQSSMARSELSVVLPVVLGWAVAATALLLLCRRSRWYRQLPPLLQALLPMSPALLPAAVAVIVDIV